MYTYCYTMLRVVKFWKNVQSKSSDMTCSGNRVLSYGGSLSLRQKFSSESDQKSERGNDVILDGGDIRLFWTNPNQFPSGISYVSWPKMYVCLTNY